MTTHTSVVVPCYDEEARLPVSSFDELELPGRELRFVFVDDGSRDGTLRLLRGMAERRPERYSVLALPENRGKAEAVRRGMLAALADEADFVGFWDADLATPLDELPRFISLLEDRPEVDVALGSRVKLLGYDIVRRPTRHYLGRVFATAASLTLSLPVYDTQCGAKLFRAAAGTADLFAEPFLARWIFDVEVLARHVRKCRASSRDPESSLEEIPLRSWRDAGASKVKPLDFLVAAFELARIRRTYPDIRQQP